MFGRIALVISATIYCFPRRAGETRLYPRPSITFLHPFYLFPCFSVIPSFLVQWNFVCCFNMAVHVSDPSDLKLRFSYFRTPYVIISLEKRSRTWFYFCSRTLWLTSFHILYIILTFGTLTGFYSISFSIFSLIHSISTSKKLSRSPISEWPTVFGTFEYWRLNRLL